MITESDTNRAQETSESSTSKISASTTIDLNASEIDSIMVSNSASYVYENGESSQLREEKMEDSSEQILSQSEAPTVKLETFFIRPEDDGWVMGEDWEIQIPLTLSIIGLKKYIETCKGISEHRQVLKFKSTKKIIPKEREIWSIRQVGISPGSIIYIEPSFKGAWLWNPMDYYNKKLLNDVGKQIETAGCKILLSSLIAKDLVPPPIKVSLRVFLRKYPEHFRIVIETFGSEKIWVERSSMKISLPCYINETYGLGAKFPLKLPDFDFAQYADIDGTQRIEITVEPLKATYHFTIMAAENLFRNDIFQKAYVYCVVWWDRVKLGITSVRLKRFGACKFFEKRFNIVVLASTDIAKISLYIQIFEISYQGIENILGGVEVTGLPLKQLLCSGKSISTTEDITSNKISATDIIMRRSSLSSAQKGRRRASSPLVPGQHRGSTLLPYNLESDFTKSLRTSRQSETHMDPAPSLRLISLNRVAAVQELGSISALSLLRFGNASRSNTSLPVEGSNKYASRRSTTRRNQKAAEYDDANEVTSKKPQYPQVFGQMHFRGGLDSYEVSVLSARGLSKAGHFAVILWVDIDVGHTVIVADSTQPTWSAEDLFQLKVPLSLSMDECVLEVQVWSTMPKEPERRGDFNGAVRLTGDELKHFLTGVYPWATRIEKPLVRTPSLPKEVQKDKCIQGFVTLVGGASGLVEKEADVYILQILSSFGLGKKVFCIVYWMSLELYRTPVYNAAGDAHWEDQKIAMRVPNGADLTLGSSLKIEVYEKGFTGTGEFLGCISLENLDVCRLLCESYAIIRDYPLLRDAEKDDNKQRNVRGSLTLRGGTSGARCIDERTIIVYACRDLALVNNAAPSAFCIIFLNNIQIYKSSVAPSTACPHWDDICVHCNLRDLTLAASLDIQIWNIGSTVFLGGLLLTGNEILEFLDTPSLADTVLRLTVNGNIKAKQSVDGLIRIGTPGTSYVSLSQAEAALEASANESVISLDEDF